MWLSWNELKYNIYILYFLARFSKWSSNPNNLMFLMLENVSESTFILDWFASFFLVLNKLLYNDFYKNKVKA